MGDLVHEETQLEGMEGILVSGVCGEVEKVELWTEWLLITESGLGKFLLDNGERVRYQLHYQLL